MEKLEEMCEQGVSMIKLVHDWEELDAAKEFLTSAGYVESRDEDGVVTFSKDKFLGNQGSLQVFEQLVNEAKYGHTVATRSEMEGWDQYAPWQLQRAMPDVLKVQLPNKLQREQNVGIVLQVQPCVKVERGHAAVRLQIECLSVGVSKGEALRSEEHEALGFYPAKFTISFKPKGVNQLLAIARTIGARELGIDVDNESTTKLISASTASVKLTVNPSLTVGHSRTKEREKRRSNTKASVLPNTVDAASIGGFKWSIQRWTSGGGNYVHECPHKGLKFYGTPKLPFQGATVRLDGQFPDLEWKFSSLEEAQKLSFEVRIEVKMDLVWFMGTKVLRAFASRSADPLSFIGEWELLMMSSR